MASSAEANTRGQVSLEKLPADILHHVHSLLPVQDAARAACVSRVFLCSWRCYSDLTLNSSTLGLTGKMSVPDEREIYRVINKVDQILKNHYSHGVKVKKLTLDLSAYININTSCVDRWLQIAAKSGIEDLTLTMYPDPVIRQENYYIFPSTVFSDKEAASSIQSLDLSYCAFHPTSIFGCFERLKSLNLSIVHITEEGLGHLLSKSSALEHLVMFACNGIICLRIPCTLKKLKILRVKLCKVMRVVEIDAPNLCCFHYGGTPLVEISVRNSSQLKNVDLSSFLSSAPGILSYTRSSLPSIAPNVESLTMFTRSESVDTPMLPSKFLQLKNMEIEVFPMSEAFSQSYDVFSLVSFLDASPVLNSFILRVGRYAVKQDLIFGDDYEYQRRKPVCRHKSLRQVTITGFCSAKSMVELTIHILESAPSLERLTLDTSHSYSRRYRCHASREICQCSPMSKTDLVEAHKAVEVAGRYITGRVPSGVKFQVLEPCRRCHSGNA